MSDHRAFGLDKIQRLWLPAQRIGHGDKPSPLRARRSPRLVSSLATMISVLLAAAQTNAQTLTPAVPAVPANQVDAPAVQDRFEGFNRGAFAFNRGLDRYVIGPVGHGYMRVVPKFLRDRVGSAMDNLGEPATAINDMAQGRAKRAGVATSRFLINSTLGGLGLFDVGAKMGLEPHESDFGQTLGRYGTDPGAYVVLPLLGPTTARDGVGRVVDIFSDPVTLATGGTTTTFGLARTGVTGIDARASADGAIRALDDATDPYATLRSAYLQRRAAMMRSARGEVEVLPDFDAETIEP
jgi:phospholipid-binding lipoprotein MlaA